MEDRIPKDIKLATTREIVGNYARSNPMSPDQLCEVITKVYATIDGMFPDPEKRKVGLG
jgi:predicted transcriptional regulator